MAVSIKISLENVRTKMAKKTVSLTMSAKRARSLTNKDHQKSQKKNEENNQREAVTIKKTEHRNGQPALLETFPDTFLIEGGGQAIAKRVFLFVFSRSGKGRRARGM